MGASYTARMAFGIVGQVSSLGIFLSPMEMFQKMLKSRSTLEFSPVPFVCTLLNCIFWVCYGTKKVTEKGELVLSINAVGIALQVFYISLFTYLGSRRTKLQITGMVLVLVAVATSVIVPIFVAVDKRKDRKLIMGLIADIFCILMYASPLSTLRKVVKTKSSASLPFYLTLTLCANGAIWTLYAIMPGYFDPYILVPNGLGLVLSCSQLLLYFRYSRSVPAGSTKDELPVTTKDLAAEAAAPVEVDEDSIMRLKRQLAAEAQATITEM